MSFSDFTDLIELIQGLIPKLNLLNPALTVEQIKLADSISINIYTKTAGSQPKSSDNITTRDRIPNPEEAEPEKSTELSPPEQLKQFEKGDFPFSSGIHLRVNQSSWWNSGRHICIGQLKVIPLLVEQKVRFQGIERPSVDEFQVCLHSNERLIVGNLEGCEDTKSIDLSNFFDEHSLRVKSSDWTFKKYSHEQVIKFDMLPEIVLTLSETIAEKAIVMKRKHDTLSVEYYVLVLSSSNSIQGK